jgi:hypothetical protein
VHPHVGHRTQASSEFLYAPLEYGKIEERNPLKGCERFGYKGTDAQGDSAQPLLPSTDNQLLMLDPFDQRFALRSSSC